MTIKYFRTSIKYCHVFRWIELAAGEQKTKTVTFSTILKVVTIWSFFVDY